MTSQNELRLQRGMPVAAPRLLFVENDDSFSWNVLDRLPVPRDAVTVVSGRDGAGFRAHLEGASALVIGPGPLDPLRAGLQGVVEAAAARAIPVLGICLGHQAIGLAFGAKLVRSEPCHGMRSLALFGTSRCFRGITGPVEVMRYHSLSLDEVRAPLRVCAATTEGVVMAIEHETLPIAGLQFHPDSFGTPRGEELLAAFFRSIS